ncbi:urate hydroxylase PuuD [Neptunomonas phycophila]|uniref:Urate hydroxylase PuuD n=2 Tax=Neptunomonas phycophila TaxID=1572645 RepID=A0AAW7XJD8_9GAMM|nr:urate hydroxylase PuuD [Neptunomonas phycophila]MDO6453172.1 urate hydroxylase PuuD [Neptunomonas phycophila]MDO6469281.1 urate hydroxylase PuuD [Neptunomonas phycophila]
MDPYLNDWLSLVIRFLHVVTAIAWIGASFYFVWLDNTLQTPPDWKKKKGISGDLWAVHGGGFYEVAKYKLAPESMPETLHWFKWEAYSTWITGFLMLILIYYIGADAYLIDPNKADISQTTAILIGVGAIFGSYFIYDFACKTPLVEKGLLFGIVMLVLLTFLAWLLGLVFSDRGTYIHIGAIIGTCMAANVMTVIMPGQRALVTAVEKGEAPDPKYGYNAKLRSVHNNYATLPVLFIMLSNHYPMTFGHEYGWLVLGAIMLIAAWARHFFNLRHRGIVKPSILISAIVAFAALAWILKPTPIEAVEGSTGLTDAQAITLVKDKCGTCHSKAPTDDVFTVAPSGVMYDTSDEIMNWLPRIHARAIISKDMPFMNKTQMTDEQRAQLSEWITKKQAAK